MKLIFKFSIFLALIAFIIVGASESLMAELPSGYQTPTSWARHFTPNGVRQSAGVSFNNGMNIKGNLTTRGQIRYGDDVDGGLFQYARLRLSEMKLGNGAVNLNINTRFAGDFNPTMPYEPLSNYRYLDGLHLSAKQGSGTQFDWRIYQANVEFNKVIPYTDLILGRLYLDSLSSYKIDGGLFKIDPTEYFKMNIYAGRPTSFYTTIESTMLGLDLIVPINSSQTQIKGMVSYFFHDNNRSLWSIVGKLRLDQGLNFSPALSGSLFAELDFIQKVLQYHIGGDIIINPSKTGFSAYVRGSHFKNDSINPYLSIYETSLGEDEYVMGGVKITQAVKDIFLIGLSYDGKFSPSEVYATRDYHRARLNFDFVGLIHKDNYLSIFGDFYYIPKFQNLDSNMQIAGGLQLTQTFSYNIDLYLGTSIENYRFSRVPADFENNISGRKMSVRDFYKDANSLLAVAYVGLAWQAADWCNLSLDYTFAYADFLKEGSIQPNDHTIELWVNFMW